jgi:Flp pilus assembly pilin Flp
MTRRLRLSGLQREEKGVGAVEFALVAPVLLLLIFGILQLGTLFLANHGLRNAVAEGARYATIFPRPTEAQIRQRILDGRFGMRPDRITGPTFTWQEVQGSNPAYVEITMSYSAPIDFIFFRTPPVQLSTTRRAFIQPPPPAPA